MANFSPEAKMILEQRYLLKDIKGQVIEAPDKMLERVAETAAEAESQKSRSRWKAKFLAILDELVFLPNSPTLMNAGKENGQLSACFVLPIEDSIEAIFNGIKNAAIIHKTGGGTGFSFSKLRPANSIVKTTKGVASGPVSFLRVYDAATGAIKQGGTRRGANLACLDVTHFDIMEFIRIKRDHRELENFNLSVGVTDRFMEAVQRDRSYQLFDPHSKEHQEVSARQVFEEVCESIWLCGDPGVIFLDEVNRHNLAPQLGRIEATNPCGEQPLHPWGSCNLGSIDVSKFVRSGFVDEERLREVVDISVRFLDNIISVTSFPTVKIKNKAYDLRNIGLGIMGWADLLARLNIEYDTAEALKLGSRLIQLVQRQAVGTSKQLKREKGGTRFSGTRRNTTLTTVAPTGTVSILAGCSSGIEPIFDLSYSKRVLNGIDIQMRAVTDKQVRTAKEISSESHVRMQAVFQQYVDSGVSKTVNLPETATRAQIGETIMLAHKLRCKGITLFREGSKEGILKSIGLSECQGNRCVV